MEFREKLTAGRRGIKGRREICQIKAIAIRLNKAVAPMTVRVAAMPAMRSRPSDLSIAVACSRRPATRRAQLALTNQVALRLSPRRR